MTHPSTSSLRRPLPAPARKAGGVARRHALACAAAAALAAPGAQAQIVFTGNSPVYAGSWFNGSFVEVQEFQFALDWAGWCSARPGSICTNHRYWGAAGNWDSNVVPGLASEVRVEAGSTVRVGTFNSVFLGPISGTSFAGTLAAAGRIELFGLLRVGTSGSIADLYNDRDNGGTLETIGQVSIGLLSSGAGRFQGTGGTTIVGAFTPSATLGLFEPRVGAGHTLQFSGNGGTTATVAALDPMARFVNTGTLGQGGITVRLQGTATFAELPVFVNEGNLAGAGAISGVKFENRATGVVQVGSGQALSMGNWGEHSGRFVGDAGSAMRFVGIGSAGHSFAAGSQVSTLGAVDFSLGNHRVQGSFSASGVNATDGGTLVFDGPRPTIGNLVIGGFTTAALRNADGAAIQGVTINGEFSRLDVETGLPLDLVNLRLLLGSFNARVPVSISGSVEWASGFLINSDPTTVTGNWRLLAGDRALRTNVTNTGNVSWEGGRFVEWGGRFNHNSGSQFDIWGDFSSAGGTGGRFINSGTVSKRSGAGRSELAMPFDSIGGTARSLSGTLALTGGGTHTDATFFAEPGARIELSGGTAFGGQILTTGRLDLAGGDFTLLTGSSYQHAAGNRFEVADLRINSGAQLRVVENVLATGSVTNLGTFSPAGNVSVGLDFLQQGGFTLNAGRNLSVQGTFDLQQPLTTQGGSFTVGLLLNRSTLNVTRDASFFVESLDNRGTLVLGPADGTELMIASIGGGTNSGNLRVDGTQVRVSSNNLRNTGVMANEGRWEAAGTFVHSAGGRFDNNGSLFLNGDTRVTNASFINNNGLLELREGSVFVGAGSEIRGPGSYTQREGVTQVDGRLQAGGGILIESGLLKGAGTVEGFVEVVAGAAWRPGTSPGTMTVLGTANLLGNLEIEIESSSVFDRLVVSDTFAAGSTARIDFVFGVGYLPQEPDGESIPWLAAASTSIAPGASVNFTGVPAQWTATLADGGRQVVLSNDLAVQIPTSGSHSIAFGEVQFNALTSQAPPTPQLARLDNAGFFNNRTGASASAAVLNNEAGATLVNRGDLFFGTLTNSGSLRNRVGATLSGQTLDNSGVLVNEGNLQVLGGGLTNAPGAVLEQRGSMQVNGVVANNGSLLVAGPMTYSPGFNTSGSINIAPGGSITGGPGSFFWQSSGDLRVDGLLEASDIQIFGGTLSGTGSLRGALTTFAEVRPGNSIGLLTVDGALDSRGTLSLEIESASAIDRLVVSGSASLGGTAIYLLGEYRPTLGDSFNLVSVGGTLQVGNPDDWVVLRLVDPLDVTSGWVPWANSLGIYDPNVPSEWRAVFSQGSLSITAVPEPGAWALMLAGLGVVGWLVARRRGGVQ